MNRKKLKKIGEIMYQVRFIDLYTKHFVDSEIDDIPRTGDMLKLTGRGKHYVVRGVARDIDEEEGKTDKIVIYLENSNQTYWMNSLASDKK
ncbi:hypothetical protein HMPREF9088_0780 [Enterococcus italicus DSM 15952]|jgi:hypothetical protein|uniref:Uncharacterized protein n=2 Tax=Enterococcus italicus TaxID=246144 RepID=E6LEJ0_ENTI1|nr:hypothetical protein HMPREF9088_0780 [Enterococcus italicus DSM 15952]OJG61083.1 50S ribosomal protein L21 [Enterococcus italicus DSM 15952]